MAETDSSSPSSTSEPAASLASIAENLQRSAVQSARTVQHNSSTQFRTFQYHATSGVSKCTLCLSNRQHPTATSCGHVFCWNCITEWCNEKPECPLCRTPITHSSLVCVYHSDF